MPRTPLRPVQRSLTLVSALSLTVVMVGGTPTRVEAQDAPPPPQVAIQLPGAGASPGGAFLRAVLVPGWGHASIGSYRRAGFYFMAETVTAWGLLKTNRRISEALDRARVREDILLAEIAAQGVTEQAEIDELLDGDPALADLRGLEVARRSQQEDWAAIGIFLLFLSGADAYVSAHLKDFPVPLELTSQVVGERLELSVGLKLPN